VEGIIGCARSGLLHQLVTDVPTAEAALRLLRARGAGGSRRRVSRLAVPA